MTLTIEKINCAEYDRWTKRIKPFNVAKYSFDYQTNSDDKELLDKIIVEGTSLANKVNPGAANNASQKRDFDKILNNCIAGILSEFLWKHFLNSNQPLVAETNYESASNQIDLKILSNSKKIEVRSSFPRNGIHFAICSSTHEFDVMACTQMGISLPKFKKITIFVHYFI